MLDPESDIGAVGRAWALAVHGAPFPPAQAEQLKAWLEADPRHRQAYEQAEAVILLVGEAYADAAATPPPAIRPRPGRVRWAPAGALGLLAASLAGAVFLLSPAKYETKAGQTRDVALSDGSHVLMGPGSRLLIPRRVDPRRVRLQAGEAFFVVAHRAGRSFEVDAEPARVTVLGTRFNVHRGLSGATKIEVEQGAVRVRSTLDDRSTQLAAGDQAAVDARGLRVLSPSHPAASWRGGWLTYDNAPLADIIGDINRYGGHTYVIATPGLNALTVTGAFKASDRRAFVAQLPHGLPLRLVADGPGRTRLVGAPGSK